MEFSKIHRSDESTLTWGEISSILDKNFRNTDRKVIVGRAVKPFAFGNSYWQNEMNANRYPFNGILVKLRSNGEVNLQDYSQVRFFINGVQRKYFKHLFIPYCEKPDEYDTTTPQGIAQKAKYKHWSCGFILGKRAELLNNLPTNYEIDKTRPSYRETDYDTIEDYVADLNQWKTDNADSLKSETKLNPRHKPEGEFWVALQLGKNSKKNFGYIVTPIKITEETREVVNENWEEPVTPIIEKILNIYLSVTNAAENLETTSPYLYVRAGKVVCEKPINYETAVYFPWRRYVKKNGRPVHKFMKTRCSKKTGNKFEKWLNTQDTYKTHRLIPLAEHTKYKVVNSRIRRRWRGTNESLILTKEGKYIKL